jgi:predicted  nucleic acid-binding Zn-ribbon protein
MTDANSDVYIIGTDEEKDKKLKEQLLKQAGSEFGIETRGGTLTFNQPGKKYNANGFSINKTPENVEIGKISVNSTLTQQEIDKLTGQIKKQSEEDVNLINATNFANAFRDAKIHGGMINPRESSTKNLNGHGITSNNVGVYAVQCYSNDSRTEALNARNKLTYEQVTVNGVENAETNIVTTGGNFEPFCKRVGESLNFAVNDIEKRIENLPENEKKAYKDAQKTYREAQESYNKECEEAKKKTQSASDQNSRPEVVNAKKKLDEAKRGLEGQFNRHFNKYADIDKKIQDFSSIKNNNTIDKFEKAQKEYKNAQKLYAKGNLTEEEFNKKRETFGKEFSKNFNGVSLDEYEKNSSGVSFDDYENMKRGGKLFSDFKGKDSDAYRTFLADNNINANNTNFFKPLDRYLNNGSNSNRFKKDIEEAKNRVNGIAQENKEINQKIKDLEQKRNMGIPVYGIPDLSSVKSAIAEYAKVKEAQLKEEDRIKENEEKTIKKHNSILQKGNDETDKLNSKIDDINNRIKETNKQIENSNKELKEKNDEIKEIEEEYKLRQSGKAGKNEKYKDTPDSELKKMSDERIDEYEKLKQGQESLKTDINTLKIDLEKTKDEISKRNKEIESEKGEIESNRKTGKNEAKSKMTSETGAVNEALNVIKEATKDLGDDYKIGRDFFEKEFGEVFKNSDYKEKIGESIDQLFEGKNEISIGELREAVGNRVNDADTKGKDSQTKIDRLNGDLKDPKKVDGLGQPTNENLDNHNKLKDLTSLKEAIVKYAEIKKTQHNECERIVSVEKKTDEDYNKELEEGREKLLDFAIKQEEAKTKIDEFNEKLEEKDKEIKEAFNSGKSNEEQEKLINDYNQLSEKVNLLNNEIENLNKERDEVEKGIENTYSEMQKIKDRGRDDANIKDDTKTNMDNFIKESNDLISNIKENFGEDYPISRDFFENEFKKTFENDEQREDFMKQLFGENKEITVKELEKAISKRKEEMEQQSINTQKYIDDLNGRINDVESLAGALSKRQEKNNDNNTPPPQEDGTHRPPHPEYNELKIIENNIDTKNISTKGPFVKKPPIKVKETKTYKVNVPETDVYNEGPDSVYKKFDRELDEEGKLQPNSKTMRFFSHENTFKQEENNKIDEEKVAISGKVADNDTLKKIDNDIRISMTDDPSKLTGEDKKRYNELNEIFGVDTAKGESLKSKVGNSIKDAKTPEEQRQQFVDKKESIFRDKNPDTRQIFSDDRSNPNKINLVIDPEAFVAQGKTNSTITTDIVGGKYAMRYKLDEDGNPKLDEMTFVKKGADGKYTEITDKKELKDMQEQIKNKEITISQKNANGIGAPLKLNEVINARLQDKKIEQVKLPSPPSPPPSVLHGLASLGARDNGVSATNTAGNKPRKNQEQQGL